MSEQPKKMTAEERIAFITTCYREYPDEGIVYSHEALQAVKEQVAQEVLEVTKARDEALEHIKSLCALLRDVIPFPPDYAESPKYEISDVEWATRMSRGSHFAAYVCGSGGSCWFESRDAALKAVDVWEGKR